MSETLNLAMIGCGGMMGAHARGYRALWEKDIRNFRILACCDVRREAAEAMADQIADFQGQRPAVYETVEALLEGEADLQAGGHPAIVAGRLALWQPVPYLVGPGLPCRRPVEES